MRPLPVVLLLSLAFPAAAQAGEPALVSRDLPLRGERALAAAAPRFDLVGLHWQGPGRVEFRTRSLPGRWSAWRPAAPEDEDLPDFGGRERSVPGWRIGNPWWTGPADAIQVRARGAVRRVRAHFVSSAVTAAPPRTLSVAGSPAIVPRLSWGANESIRRAAPSYAPDLRFAIVHHTAGSNSYTRAQSAAIVRAIQLYHVRGNGWNDLGYNFVVDKYGQVFEGRFGGADRNVVGAHAEGFNTGSVGVAVLGSYGGAGISAAARDALAGLLAWRLDVAHVDPLTTLSWPSGGNSRFPRGIPVFLRAVAGHRDTGFTSCPGDRLYAQLGDIAQSVAVTGLPKLYSPAVRGAVGGPLRFTGRLSAALPWTVRVTDALGNPVASGTGLGTAVDWTWDATTAPPGAYAWAIEAPGVLPATGVIGGKPVAVSVTRVRVEPGIVSPNGDRYADEAVVSYTLGAPATVTATVVDTSGGTLATLFAEPRAAGPQSFVFTPQLPDGAYRVVLTATNGGGKPATGSAQLVINRTLSSVEALAAAFSPNGDGRADAIRFRFLLLSSAQVRVRVLRDGRWVATPLGALLPAGIQTVSWDGFKRHGRLPDGTYEAEISATNMLGTVSQRVAFASDTRRPDLRLVSLRPLRVWVSEPGRLLVWVNGARRELEIARAGRLRVPSRPVRTLRAIAWDTAGNRSRPTLWP